MSATIFTVANQKGGVGKTTTVVNLGAALAQRVGRTLIVDLDPQANATSGLGIRRTGGGSIYGPMSGEAPLSEAILPTAIEELSIIPSRSISRPPKSNLPSAATTSSNCGVVWIP